MAEAYHAFCTMWYKVISPEQRANPLDSTCTREEEVFCKIKCELTTSTCTLKSIPPYNHTCKKKNWLLLGVEDIVEVKQ